MLCMVAFCQCDDDDDDETVNRPFELPFKFGSGRRKLNVILTKSVCQNVYNVEKRSNAIMQLIPAGIRLRFFKIR